MSKDGKSARSRRPAPEVQSGIATFGPRVAWLIGLTLWALLAASLLSFDPADAPGHSIAPHNATPSNWIGPVGAFVAHHTFQTIGSGVWILLLATGAYLAALAYRGPVTQLALRTLGILILALALSSFHHLLLPGFSRFPEGPGGLLAIAFTEALVSRFGSLGAFLWTCLLAAVGATVAFDRWILDAPTIVARAMFVLVMRGWNALRSWIAERFPEQDVEEVVARTASPAALATAGPAAPPRRVKRHEAESRARAASRIAVVEDDAEEVDEVESEGEELPGAPQVFDQDALKQKISRLPVRFATKEVKSATQEDLESIRAQRRNEEEADRKYVFPGLDLLENPETTFNEEMERYVREQAQALESALRTYGISGEVVGIESGPVITLYQVRLAPGTKVSSISSVSSDIARALRAVNIRIVPNTEGMDTVGIEVPNRMKEKVRLKELMTSSDATARMKLPTFLGKDASGNPLIADLAEMPHMLIAGTTGSGKSVCINAIIMGFLYTQKPSDMKLILVDPKMVELSQFKDIPHLMCPVVTEMSKAAAILEWAVSKMDERYEILVEAGCRDIASYNSLSWEEKKERLQPASEVEEAMIPRKLPYIVFVIDELADLMMTNKEVEGSIVRIAQKARAVGIHLILATQRPQANVVTGLIKSNMPARIAFKVASGMDSRIVLDQKGGELLLGQGDMLMLTPRSSRAMRCQGTLVDDKETRRVVKFVREVSEPSFERQLLQIRKGQPLDEVDEGKDSRVLSAEEHEARMRQSAQEDPLFDRAVEIVLETRRGSVSLLQRRLAIGYTRASRLIELMGFAGIIGEHKGSVAREVIMSLEEWDAMKQLHSDAESSRRAPQPTLFEGEATQVEDDEFTDSEDSYVDDEEVDDETEADDEDELIDEVDDETEQLDSTGVEEEVDDVEPEDEAEVESEESDDAPTDEAEDVGEDEEWEEVDESEESDDAEEYEYVDEDGNPIPEDELEDGEEEWEYEYVDEDGNPIDDEEEEEED